MIDKNVMEILLHLYDFVWTLVEENIVSHKPSPQFF